VPVAANAARVRIIALSHKANKSNDRLDYTNVYRLASPIIILFSLTGNGNVLCRKLLIASSPPAGSIYVRTFRLYTRQPDDRCAWSAELTNLAGILYCVL
jgi:hypothetical protein